MGQITVDVELENMGDRQLAQAGFRAEDEVRGVTVRAIADTGAVMLVLPKDVVDRLGVPVVSTITTAFADGRRGQLPVAGTLTIRIGDRWMPTNCVVVPEGAEALVGQVVMETLDLIPDPVNQTLGPRPESPDRPLLRV
ncbi:MAG: hypothetical protein F4W96_03120 [Chloroflexi bacterium]|nr:hypothetical protein [Chloroflexota bacterium]